MNKDFINIIKKFSENETTLNKILVSLFVKSNAIKIEKNILIRDLLLTENSEVFSEPLSLQLQSFSFDDLIEAFELAIPSVEKTINGAVYTPNFIKSFIVENALSKTDKNQDEILSGDISCGCGAFLFTLANKIHYSTKKSFNKIFRDNIFGLDISETSIRRTEILLTLLALSNGEDQEKFEFNLYCGNALSFDWFTACNRIKNNEGFDIIVGNPPYVRAKNLDEGTKKMLSDWAVTKSGNPDLYIPFFEIGLKYLNVNGILGYITVNSFFKSVNARQLRKYFEEKKYDISIIDFGDEKIFDKISAYTCICFITKKESDTIAYKKESAKSLTKNGLTSFNHISFNDLNYHKGWLLNNKIIVENIRRIESTGKTLGDLYNIKNGIATLSNDIYIFKPVSETKKHYLLVRNNKEYQIEKSICRDIIKPNILKFEHEIETVKEKLIYPYTNGISPLSLMKEEYLKNNFPKAYDYLLEHKVDLHKRDKGNGNYGEWYAFGRTQALSDKGYKLLFPYMAKKPYFVFTDQKEMMLYCGYAIFNDSVKELKILKRILESKVFEYYIANTSKPYSSGYLSYGKNYVKNFGICELNEQDKYFLSNGATKEEVDDFLVKKYRIKI